MGSDISVGKRLFGYSEHSRQFTRRLQVRVPHLEFFDGELARAFLEEAFKIESARISSPLNNSGKVLRGVEEDYLTIALSLARSLLRASGIPSFEREVLLGFLADGGKRNHDALLAIPAVENMPPRLYLSAYIRAFQIAFEFTRTPVQHAQLKKKSDELKESLIKPLRHIGQGRPLNIFILREAFENDVQFNHYGGGVYRLGLGASATLFSRSATERDAVIGARASQDKAITMSWLKDNGVPTPQSHVVANVEEAQKAATTIGFPVVVKPADRDRSEGVMLDIASSSEVAKAFDAARKLSNRVLVEERITGHCHRLVTFRHRFVFAFTRHPKSVLGDGEHSVAELVAEANRISAARAEHVRDKLAPLDDAAGTSLAEQGLTPKSVPAKDRIVHLRRNNTVEDGGHNEIITDAVHPENICLAERISRILRLDSMGLDLISTDPTKPWHENGAAVTEVNYTPQIGENSARFFIEMEFGANRGNIPVHCYLGDKAAFDRALEHQDQLHAEGCAAFLVTRDYCAGPDQARFQLTGHPGLFERTAILQNDKSVEAMVLHLEDDEFLERGRPMLAVSSVEKVNDAINSFQDHAQSIQQTRIDALMRTIQAGCNAVGELPAQ